VRYIHFFKDNVRVIDESQYFALIEDNITFFPKLEKFIKKKKVELCTKVTQLGYRFPITLVQSLDCKRGTVTNLNINPHDTILLRVVHAIDQQQLTVKLITYK
jgi:hypothetical protein